MNIKQAAVLTALIAAAAGISPLAFAQDRGWYVGASAGFSKVQDFCSNPVPVGTSCDETDAAYSLFGGYQFFRFLGVELGVTDLGKFKSSDLGLTETISAWGVELLAVGTFPINPRFEIFGKAGGYAMDMKSRCEGTCSFSSVSDTATNLTYGIGAKFNFTKHVGMRLQYQRYSDVGFDITVGGQRVKAERDVDVFGLAFVFNLY